MQEKWVRLANDSMPALGDLVLHADVLQQQTLQTKQFQLPFCVRKQGNMVCSMTAQVVLPVFPVPSNPCYSSCSIIGVLVQSIVLQMAHLSCNND